MSRPRVVVSLCTAAAALALIVWTCGCQDAGPESAPTTAATVDHGRYLVDILGCHDCHTPLKLGINGPEPDLSRALSGHPETFVVGDPPTLGEGGWVWAGAGTNTAFAGPWGISYAPNLTPDEESGLGMWTEEMFVGAMREGKKFGNGRPLMPPMPWPAYSHLTDQDVRAVFAYLKTVKPIVNHVPEGHQPAN